METFRSCNQSTFPWWLFSFKTHLNYAPIQYSSVLSSGHLYYGLLLPAQGIIMVLFNLPRILQVFPLLIKKFSHEEQADLVWQFLCSIPVNMMAKFLPWIASCVSADENQDILDCLSKIVPEEKLLQEVLMIMTSDILNSICKVISVSYLIYLFTF